MAHDELLIYRTECAAGSFNLGNKVLAVNRFTFFERALEGFNLAFGATQTVDEGFVRIGTHTAIVAHFRQHH